MSCVMFASMQAPRIDLFEWLLRNAPHATYNLAFSNIHGLTIHEYKAFAEPSFSDSFELGSNAQYGADELKQTLCSMYSCDPHNIVTTTGATEGNFLLFSSLLSKGDEFIIEQPGYQPMWLTPEMLGAHRIKLPRLFENKFKVESETLSNYITKKTKLVVLTNLHNPSGVLMDKKTIISVAKIASEYGAYVLVDEIFLDGSFVAASSSFGIPNVIVTGSATKIYGLGGLHSGWVIAPPEVATLCQRMKAHTTGASSYTSEIMTARILRVARHELIKRFKERGQPNREYLKKWMRSHTEFFDWVEPDGGIMCFPRYHLKMSSVDLCSSLFQSQKILVNPGSYFNQEGFVRISYGCELPLLQDALDALEKGMQSLQAHH
jgi:aspartate/methionine/tyrosine aminotransferase